MSFSVPELQQLLSVSTTLHAASSADGFSRGLVSRPAGTIAVSSAAEFVVVRQRLPYTAGR